MIHLDVLLKILTFITEFEIKIWGGFAFYALFSMVFTFAVMLKYVIKCIKIN